MANTTKAVVGKTILGGIVGGCCGAAASCAFCGIQVAIIGGATIGAFILCVACYAGSKYKDLHLVGKGAVAVSATAVGAFSGVSVVESAALGAGLVVGAPALIAGAVVGIALVGSAVVVGALAAASDRENDAQERVAKLEAQMALVMQSMANNNNGGA